MTNTIQLSPSQAHQFLPFLEENKTTLEKVVIKEAEERKRISGEVYSLILRWRRERKKAEWWKSRANEIDEMSKVGRILVFMQLSGVETIDE